MLYLTLPCAANVGGFLVFDELPFLFEVARSGFDDCSFDRLESYPTVNFLWFRLLAPPAPIRPVFAIISSDSSSTLIGLIPSPSC